MGAESAKMWKKRNPAKVRASENKRRAKVKSTLEGRFRMNLISKKAQYKHSNIQMTLTVEWCLEEYKKGCAATGVPFVFEGDFQHPNSPSIDRIKAGGDYTPENCRLITKRMNELKRNANIEELRALVYYMDANLKLGKI